MISADALPPIHTGAYPHIAQEFNRQHRRVISLDHGAMAFACRGTRLGSVCLETRSFGALRSLLGTRCRVLEFPHGTVSSLHNQARGTWEAMRVLAGRSSGRPSSFSTAAETQKIVPESMTLKRSRKLLGGPVLQRQLRAILHADLSSSSVDGEVKQLYSPNASVRHKIKQSDEKFLTQRRMDVAWVDSVVERLLSFSGGGSRPSDGFSAASMHLGRVSGSATWESTHLVENANFKPVSRAHGIKATVKSWRLPIEGARRRAIAAACARFLSDEQNNIRLIAKAFRGRAINAREVLYRLSALTEMADKFAIEGSRGLSFKSGRKGRISVAPNLKSSDTFRRRRIDVQGNDFYP